MNSLQLDVQELFQSVFDDEQILITRTTSAEDVEGWDSLMHINLIVAVEQAFGIRFATAEISNLKEDGKTVGDMLDLIESKRALG